MFEKLGALTVAMMAISLAACGGGGEEDEDDDLPDVEDASGAGIWTGSYRIDGVGTAMPFYGLVTEEADFVIVAGGSPYRVFFGTGTTNGISFSANALSYSGLSKTPSSFQGTVIDGVSMTGSYALSGESALFTMQYNSTYTRGASLATLAGTYSFTLPAVGSTPGTTVTIDIQATGAFTYTSSASGCTVAGNLTVPHANRNYYRWTGTPAACGAGDSSMTGVAYLGDLPAGQNTLLFFMGQNQLQSAALSVVAEKS